MATAGRQELRGSTQASAGEAPRAVAAEAAGSAAATPPALGPLFENVDVAMLVVDEDGAVVDANAAACGLFRHRRQSLRGMPVERLQQAPADDAAGALRRARQRPGERRVQAFVDAEGGCFRAAVELARLQLEGRRWRLLTLHPVAPPATPGAAAVPAPAVPADEQARRSLAFEQAALAIMLVRPDGVVVDGNAALTRLLGFDAANLRGRRYAELVHPADRSPAVGAFPGAALPAVGVREDERRYLRRDGAVVRAHAVSTLARDEQGRAAYVVVTLRDVTEERAATEALRRSEQSLRMVTDNSPAAIYLKDLDGRYLLVNRRMRDMFGIDPELAIGERVDRWVDAELAQLIARDDRRVVARRAPLVKNYRYVRGDGSVLVLETTKFALFDEAGNAVAVGGIDTDVTERVRAEEALRDGEERFRQLVEHLDEGIVVWDVGTGAPVYANPACGALWEVDPQVLTRQPHLVRRNLHPEDRELGPATLRRALRGETGDVEYRLRRPDGSVRWVWERALPVRNAGGAIYRVIAILKDITSLKLAEEQRLQRLREQREALLREVHHRIKNALQGIAGLLRRHVQDTPSLAPAVDHALREMNAVAVVYGMVGERGGERPLLQEMLQALVSSGTPGWRWRTVAGGRDRLRCLQIDSDETVPVALIVSELLSNAIKHGSGAVSADGGEVALYELEEGARVEVRHPAPPLPAGFDFDSGAGIGTGLELVRALLPPRGAALVFHWREGWLTARLDLGPPVVIDQAPDGLDT